MSETIPHTRAQLVADLQALGISAGQTVMLHAAVNSVGEVMGGPNTILEALQEVLTPTGTLMMYAGWEDIPDYLYELPEAVQQVYYAQHPPFDVATSRAVRDNSILAEFLRTMPNTRRSKHPEASMVAWGAQAEYLTAHHPLNYAYGAGSPLEKLVQLRGQVLMLGAPLDTLTILHYAENRAKLPNKRVVHYPAPMLEDGKTVWIEIEDFDTGETLNDYSFEGIAELYLAQQGGRRGRVGYAESYLFDAANLTYFAIAWLEAQFGDSA